MAKITMAVRSGRSTYTLFNDDGDELSMVRLGMEWLVVREQGILENGLTRTWRAECHSK